MSATDAEMARGSTKANSYEKPFTFCPLELGHLQAFNDIFFEEKYKGLLGLDDVNLIVDCGAHIGAASYYLKAHYPNSDLLAFEPNEENHEYLKYNFENNWEQRNVSGFPPAYQLAVYPFRTEVGLHKDHDTYTTDWMVLDGRKDVMTFPLNEVFTLKYNQIDILKISINGGERFLFEKNTQWIDKTRNIAVDCQEGSYQSIINALSEFQYTEIQEGETIFFKDIKKG